MITPASIGLPDCCPLFAEVLSSEDFRKSLKPALEFNLKTRQKEKVVFLHLGKCIKSTTARFVESQYPGRNDIVVVI